MNLIAILLEIEQLFGELLFPEMTLHGCQFALVVEFAPDASRGCLEKILDLLSENLVRHVVTIVDVALIAHAADEVITLVHTTT